MKFITLAWRNLFRNFRRTVAVICTVGLGAGALFSFDGFINGVLGEYRDSTIHAHYGYGQINTTGYRDTVFEKPTEHWIQNGDEVEQFLYSLDGVQHVFPRASVSGIIKSGSTTVSGLGLGIDAQREAQFFHSLNIEQGEMLTDQPDGILLGKGLATALGVSPGDEVTVIATSMKGKINQLTFTVTGIFHTGSKDYDSRTFKIQLDKAQKLVKSSNIESMSLALDESTEWKTIATQVQDHFPGLEATSFDVLDEVYYKHSIDWLSAQFHVVQIIILSIVLLGVFNSISSSILERKQEIGNLRANGESVFSVMKLILAEGSFLALLGSLLGMLGAYAMLMLFINKGLTMPPGPGMTRQFLVTFHFAWPMVFFTVSLSLIAAFIASALAGLRVARMPIAKALRSF